MKTAITLAALLLCASMAAAQEIELTTTDDTRHIGVWQGIHDGFYLVSVRGEVKRIPEQKVKDVRVLSPAPKKGESRAPRSTAYAQTLETNAIEEEIKNGNYERAFHLIGKFQERVRKMELEARTLYDKAHTQNLLSIIRRRDLSELQKKIRMVSGLPRANQKALVNIMALKLEEMLRREPTGLFTAHFGAALATLLSPAIPMRDDERSHLVDLLLKVGESETRAKRFSTAAEIYDGIHRLDPTRDLKGRVASTRMASIRQLRESRQFETALDTLARHLKEKPDDKEALALRQEIEFLFLKQRLGSALPPTARVLLEKFLEEERPENFSAWARDRLAAIKAQGVTKIRIARDIETYHPVKVGRSMKYRSADGLMTESIHTDSVRIDDKVLRVYYTLERKREGATTRNVFQIEIAGTRVSRHVGTRREVLLKFPLESGLTWSWTSGQQKFKRTVKSTSTTVTVPAGTYKNCLVVEFESITPGDGEKRRISSRSYYAPGVGLVKLEFEQPEYHGYGLELTGVSGKDK